MIIIHVYCSYKSSPIGFAYGSYEYDFAKDAKFYVLDNKHENSFVLSSFEDGKIRRACGRLPDNNYSSYIFLVRKIKYDYGVEHEDFGRDVDMNFAFEFDNFSEFEAFATGFINAEKQDSKQFYKELADCIFPDISIEIYKLSVNKKVFDQWFDKMLKTKPCEKYDKLKSMIKITAASSQADYSQDIIDIYQLPDTNSDGESVGIRRYKESADYLYPVPVKKKEKLFLTSKRSNLKKLLILGTVLVVVLVGLTLFVIVIKYNK